MDNKEDQYNRSGLMAFLFSVGFCLLFFVYIAYLHPGVDLKEVPESGEALPATLAGAGAKIDLSAITNPWEPSDELIQHGVRIYQTNCAICHGKDGAGDGPGSATNPPPRNFIEGNWTKGGGRIELYTTLQTGLPPSSMVSFAHLPVVDRWALVHYIRSVTKNLVQDDPAKVEEFAKTAK